MSLVNAHIEKFNQRLDSQEGKDKLAEMGGSWIRDKLREQAFSRHILPPEQVTRADCQRSVNHDTLVKIVDVEPQSRAMAIDFRSQPTARFIRGPKAEIPFFTITSEKFEKTEQELLAYEMPITKVIEDNSVKDIQEIEDREFLRHIEAGVQALQTEVNTTTTVEYNSTNIGAGDPNAQAVSVIKGEIALLEDTIGGGDPLDWVVHPIQRPDLVNLFKLLDGNRLRSERVLMTEPDHDDVLQWTVEDFGDRIQSETTVDGYKYNTLLGRKVVRTIKTDVLRPGNVYVFTAPQFFGKFYILNNTKFYIDKIANVITWQSWEDIGMGVVNIASCRKLELYRGSVRPTATDGGYEVKIPSEEEDMGAENNRVDAGLHFPDVQQW
jgi:hypothetical protein